MEDFYDLFFVLTGLDFITRMPGSLSPATVKPSCCSRTFDTHQHFASERNRRLTTVFDVKRAHPCMKCCDLMSRKFYPLAPSWADTHVCVCVCVENRPYVNTWQLRLRRAMYKSVFLLHNETAACRTAFVSICATKDFVYPACEVGQAASVRFNWSTI